MTMEHNEAPEQPHQPATPSSAEDLQAPQPMSESEVRAIRDESRELSDLYAADSDSPRPPDSRLYAGYVDGGRQAMQCGDCAAAGVDHFEGVGGTTLTLVANGDQPEVVKGYLGDDPPAQPHLQLGGASWLVFDSEAARDRAVHIGSDELSPMGLHDAMKHPNNVPDLARNWAGVAEYARAEQERRRRPETGG